MKFEDFELDLTKLPKSAGISPLSNDCEGLDEGSGGGSVTVNCSVGCVTYIPSDKCYTKWKNCPN